MLLPPASVMLSPALPPIRMSSPAPPSSSHIRSGLTKPSACSAGTSNFRMRSSPVSGGGVYTGTPSCSTRLCVSRSCHGAVRTIAVSREAASSSISPGRPSGSKSNRRSPSSIAYEETSFSQGSPDRQSGCGACQCQRPGSNSRTLTMSVRARRAAINSSNAGSARIESRPLEAGPCAAVVETRQTVRIEKKKAVRLIGRL